MKHNLNEFLKEYVKPLVIRNWSNPKFAIFSGELYVVNNSFAFHESINANACIWSVDDLIVHISNTKNVNLSTSFEWVIISFRKLFGELNESTSQMVANVYCSIIWSIIKNNHSILCPESLLDLNYDNLSTFLSRTNLIVDVNNKQEYAKLRIIVEKIQDYKSDWVVDAKSSLIDYINGKNFDSCNIKLLNDIK